MAYTGFGLKNAQPPQEKCRDWDNTELMFEDYWWVQAIHKCYDKDFGVKYLSYLCSTENRLKIMHDIVDLNFDFGIPRIAEIPKDNGGVREVYILEKDKRFLGNVLCQIYNWKYKDLISANCDSYQKGKSTSKTVKSLTCRGLSGIKVDISKYFDTVSKDIVNKYLDKIDSNSPIDIAVRKFYNTDKVILKGKEVTRYKGICQGSPLSSFLANIILRDIDDKVGSMCREYKRYSDDILALGCNTDEVLEVLKEELRKLGLSLNPDKVEILSPDIEYTFLGYGIIGKDIVLSKKSFNKKKKQVKSICKSKGALKTKIREINKLFYAGKNEFTNWSYPKFKTLTNLDRLRELDEYCKDCLRWSVTGDWNYVKNKHKVPDKKLRESGYTSLLHMYNVANTNKEIWSMTVDSVIKGITVN